MGRRKSSGVNKSTAIRNYLDANPEVKPKAVVAALKEQGVTVTAAFVSTLKSNDSRKGRQKTLGRKGARLDAGIASLVAGKKFIDKVGGVQQAREAINALDKILN